MNSAIRHRPRLILNLSILTLAFFLLLIFLYLFRLKLHDFQSDPNPNNHDDSNPISKSIVMAKMPWEDTSWLSSLPDWTPYIYTLPTDPDPTTALTLITTKGHESIAYLSYIIDHYDSLPALTAFIHATENQRHNDLPSNSSTAHLLSRLNIPVALEKGYANLRCSLTPGCPVAVRPFDPMYKGKEDKVYSSFERLYMGLFGVESRQVPEVVGGVCCAQFVVSRDRIRQRGRKEYLRMREWAAGNEELDDRGVGAVFEMVWHVVFEEDSVLCPDSRTCYCELYGLCNETELIEK